MYTRIKGPYSETRRLPRLGKIRLGLKVRTADGREYPRETPYFVCPPEVCAVYGPEPTQLDVLFPLDDPLQVCIQKYAAYGSSRGLRCHGDGERASRYDEATQQWIERACPCEWLRTEQRPDGPCLPQTHLLVILPRVSMGGCYQLTTRSLLSTIALNSALDYVRALVGRIALVPLVLRRVPREITVQGQRRTHYVLDLILDATIQQVAALREHVVIPAQYYELEPPVDEDPAADPPDVVEPASLPTPAASSDTEPADTLLSPQAVEQVRAALRARQAAAGAATPTPVTPATPAAASPPTPPTAPDVDTGAASTPTPVQPAAPAATAPREAGDAAALPSWVDTLRAVYADAALRTLSDRLLATMHVRSLYQLTEQGRIHYIRHLVAAAREAGLAWPRTPERGGPG